MALLNLPANPEDGSRPKRLPVLPAGDVIKGEDGRAWSVSDRKAVVDRLNKLDQVILDENHSLIRAAKVGGPSPALARLSKFAADMNGVIWAENVEWTKYGENAIDGGHYGGISPVLLHRAARGIISGTDVLGDVTSLHSVSLVNDPNLELPALNDKEYPEDMTPEQLTAALNSALAPMQAAVASLQAEVGALKAAPGKKAEEQTHELAVNSAMERYISANKLPNSPDARAYFTRMAKDSESLATMCAHYDAQGPLVSTEVLDMNSLDSKKLPVLGAQAAKLAGEMGWDNKKLFDGRKGI